VGYAGEDVTAMLDPAYFADLLKLLDAESTVDLSILSKDDPLLLRQDALTYVAMPLSMEK